MLGKRWQLVSLAVAQVLLVGLGLVAVGVHEPASEEPVAAAPETTTTSAAPALDGEVTTTTAVADTTTTTAPDTTTTAAPATTATTRAPADPGPQGPPAVAPGRYTYDQTGEVRAMGLSQPVPPTMVTTYSPADGTDQRSVSDSGSVGAGEEIRRRGPDGVYLVRMTFQGPDGPIVLEPDPPALYAPWPLEPGHEWSWSARLTDGSATVSQRSKSVRAEAVTVDGQPVPSVVVETTIDITGDGFKLKQVMTSWISPAHALPVKSDATITGTYNGIPIAGETATTLRSLTPA